MTPEETALLTALLVERRVLSLSVTLDSRPYTGLLPFAMQPDFSAALIHASNLARHTAALRDNAPVSFLIHAPDTPDADPLQLPRLSLQAIVHPLDKASAAYAAAQEVYVQKFPASKPIFGLGDFNLYELRPQNGRFVVAFGRALNVTADTLRDLAGGSTS